MSRKRKNQDNTALMIGLAAVVAVAAAVAACFVAMGMFQVTRKLAAAFQKTPLLHGKAKEDGSPSVQAWLLADSVWLGTGLVIGLAARQLWLALIAGLIGMLLPVLGAGCYRTRGWLKHCLVSTMERLAPKPKEDKRGLEPGLWEDARQKCFRRKGRQCYIRLPKCTGAATQVDHIVPLARGGAKYDQSNLQPSCRYCNLSKGAKLMSEIGGIRYQMARRRR